MERGEVEKGELNQLEIIDLRFCFSSWKFLFPSNIIDYIRIIIMFIYPTEGEEKEF